MLQKMSGAIRKIWCLGLVLLGIGISHNHLDWSQRAAKEAETVAAVSCSGHGSVFLDGVVKENSHPVCECNRCYQGHDCSIFLPDCAADADSGDPLFMEPFWKMHAATSAVLISGWHRMSYSFPKSWMESQELEKHIVRIHNIARNANTTSRYIVFGGGSTQLLNAAVYALSINSSHRPVKVVAATPAYPAYKRQTDFLRNGHFVYYGDPMTLANRSDTNTIEFVTSPNNPSGEIREAVLKGRLANGIYDHAYYWPHFTAIPAPADEDIMIFTLSKLTGHAGSRFGWALVKDEELYNTMLTYIDISEMGIPKETQLRTLQLMKAIQKAENNGTSIFDYAYNTMRKRWRSIVQIMSLSNRFSVQEIPPMFCNFFGKVRGPSPAYAWVKCEREEDIACHTVLRGANIIGRRGELFGVEDRYTRLSLIKGEDEFNLLLYRLHELVASEDNAKDK